MHDEPFRMLRRHGLQPEPEERVLEDLEVRPATVRAREHRYLARDGGRVQQFAALCGCDVEEACETAQVSHERLGQHLLAQIGLGVVVEGMSRRPRRSADTTTGGRAPSRSARSSSKSEPCSWHDERMERSERPPGPPSRFAPPRRSLRALEPGQEEAHSRRSRSAPCTSSSSAGHLLHLVDEDHSVPRRCCSSTAARNERRVLRVDEGTRRGGGGRRSRHPCGRSEPNQRALARLARTQEQDRSPGRQRKDAIKGHRRNVRKRHRMIGLRPATGRTGRKRVEVDAGDGVPTESPGRFRAPPASPLAPRQRADAWHTAVVR